jgi:uracil-DNA glycosylase
MFYKREDSRRRYKRSGRSHGGKFIRYRRRDTNNTTKTTKKKCGGMMHNDGNGVFCGSAPRLYNEDPRPAERITERVFLRRQLKMIEKRWQERN